MQKQRRRQELGAGSRGLARSGTAEVGDGLGKHGSGCGARSRPVPGRIRADGGLGAPGVTSMAAPVGERKRDDREREVRQGKNKERRGRKGQGRRGSSGRRRRRPPARVGGEALGEDPRRAPVSRSGADPDRARSGERGCALRAAATDGLKRALDGLGGPTRWLEGERGRRGGFRLGREAAGWRRGPSARRQVAAGGRPERKTRRREDGWRHGG